MKQLNKVLVGAVATTKASETVGSEMTPSVAEWIAKVKSRDEAVRGPAWQSAVQYGVAAVDLLNEAMADADFEVARCAKKALWLIVRHSGRPKADTERKAVVKKLTSLLSQNNVSVLRDVLWMLSEIGDDSCLDSIGRFLTHKELREDARCVLDRIPGAKATKILSAAFKTSPEDFRPNLAHSLRLRGEKISGYPSQKLVPTKKSSVSPAGSV